MERKLKGTGMICIDNVRIVSMINGTCNLPKEKEKTNSSRGNIHI